MAEQRYEPRPVPQELSPEARVFLEEELAQVAYWINLLLQYNEDNP